MRKPKGFWDVKENRQSEASKHPNRYSFKKSYSRAYINSTAEELNKYFGVQERALDGFWKIKENRRKEASKYKRLHDFRRKSHSAHRWCNEAELIEYFSNDNNCDYYWLSQAHRETEAIKYRSRVYFKRGNARAFKNCSDDELNKYFGKITIKPKGFWNIKENRQEEASKHLCIGDFAKAYSKAYTSCSKKELNKYFPNSVIDGRLRTNVYKAVFPDNSIYIGITSTPRKRFYCHLNLKGSVYEHILLTKTTPTFEVIVSNIEVFKGGQMEKDLIKKYKLTHNVLNKTKGGELGNLTSKN